MGENQIISLIRDFSIHKQNKNEEEQHIKKDESDNFYLPNGILISPGINGGTPVITSHAKLNNLDFESAGHIGFVSVAELKKHIDNDIIHVTDEEKTEFKTKNKGYFLNHVYLQNAYSAPEDGAYAIVGTGENLLLFSAQGGSWFNTGHSGMVTFADLEELRQEIKALKAK